MFDYFSSTRKANQILARVAKTAFASEYTKTIVEYQGTSASLASRKIILRLSKLDSTRWKVCAPLVKSTGSLVKRSSLQMIILIPQQHQTKYLQELQN